MEPGLTDRLRWEALCRHRWSRVLASLAVAAMCVFIGASAFAIAKPTRSYDGPSITRVGVHQIEPAEASPSQLTDAREGSASPSAKARNTSTTPLTRHNATEAATSTRVVIGGMEDLGPGSLRAGEETLASRLPGDAGPRLGNWLNNRDVLRAAMQEGAPIRDASVDSAGNLLYEDTRRFITMERDYLRSFNWTYDPSTNLWMPPG